MDEISALKEAEKQQAEAEAAATHETSDICSWQNWTFPVMLILFGIVFLLSNLGIFVLHNWWALFLWFPAVGALEKAWKTWRSRGHITRRVRRHLVGAAVWGLIGGAFLFDLSWGVIWPLLIIVWGVGLLLQEVSQR